MKVKSEASLFSPVKIEETPPTETRYNVTLELTEEETRLLREVKATLGAGS